MPKIEMETAIRKTIASAIQFIEKAKASGKPQKAYPANMRVVVFVSDAEEDRIFVGWRFDNLENKVGFKGTFDQTPYEIVWTAPSRPISHHIAYTYSPRENAGSLGGNHIVVDEDVAAGRFVCSAGKALCHPPSKQFWGLERTDRSTYDLQPYDCSECRKRAVQLGIIDAEAIQD